MIRVLETCLSLERGKGPVYGDTVQCEIACSFAGPLVEVLMSDCQIFCG